MVNATVTDPSMARYLAGGTLAYPSFSDPREPLGTCSIHGDYWTDDCTVCRRPDGSHRDDPPRRPAAHLMAPFSKDSPFGIGSDVWPGLAKVVEESSETLTEVGKLMAFPEGDHPDGKGDMRTRLEDELADLQAAIDYVKGANYLDLEGMERRTVKKLNLFHRWHNEAQFPDP